MKKQKSYIFDRSSLRMAVEVLSRGGIAVLPTDTIYGLHCSITRLRSIDRIRKLKGRDRSSGFVLLVSNLDMADRVVERWPGNSRAILSRLWPAPLTAILPARDDLPGVIAPRRSVALRIPANELLCDLIFSLGEPIVSTSANYSGEKPLRRISEIMTTFPTLDAYFSWRGGSRTLPSTIVDFRNVPPVLVRAGCVPWPKELAL